MYDFDELSAFADVMSTGSLTRSAHKLGLAKSTLSRRISQLEARLEQPLLRRQANRLIPTEAGLLFHSYCTELLAMAAHSQEALAELREEISGKVTLEVHGALARGWMAGVVDAFLTRYPKVELTLHTRESPPTKMHSNSVHIWLGATHECGLNQERLGHLTRGLYANPSYLAKAGYPKHPNELKTHAWIDLLDTSSNGLLLHHPQHDDYLFHAPRSRLRVDLTVLHIDAIAYGQGIGLLPHWVVGKREQHHPGDLVGCLPGWEPTPLPITMLYAYGHHSRRVNALLDFLREHVPTTWQTTQATAHAT
ncbi:MULTISPECIES: LysR family transcriptional regulator [Vreelandella]|uniref:LysR family transcriptional regulator n=2 Tax=Vreelandella TaxID=3137766 RepID=A0A7C9P2Y2_9GAMM|nr:MULTISPECIES: LysR family transcriptional regulator [Halomonas]NDL69890.1 LysR family transcriptional regulator [Halomonas alkaliphila]NYS45349.1 LysR family transcriptional regulator [Halomonas zhaodongensis]